MDRRPKGRREAQLKKEQNRKNNDVMSWTSNAWNAKKPNHQAQGA